MALRLAPRRRHRDGDAGRVSRGKTTITQTVLDPSKAGISESFERLAEYLQTIA
jgi:hypothetical protein